MIRVILILVLAVATVLPHVARSAESPTQIVGAQVEAVFREAMSCWSYSEYWRLWEMGPTAQRFAVTQSEFAELMRKGMTRPAGGRGVEAVRVTATSLESATVVARLGLERRNVVTVIPRSFSLQFEGGAWRINLYDFLNLSNY